MMKKLFLLSLIVCSGTYAEDMSYYRKMGENLQSTATPNFKDVKPIIEGNIPDISPDNMHQRGEALKSEHMELLKEVDLKRKDFAVSFDDSFLDRARDVQANPESYVDFLSGKYSNCKVDSKDITTKEEHICDDYTSYNENTCSVGRKIEVDAKHKYICEKRRNTYERACEKTLELKCKEREGLEEVALKNISRDMQWKYNNSYLVVGMTPNYNNHSSNATKYDGFVEFEIKELIGEFKIVQIAFNNYIRISINDKQVYIGPYEGNQLYVSRVTSRETGKRVIWEGCNGVNIGPRCHPYNIKEKRNYVQNIDLKPYLKVGINSIRVEAVVVGEGEAWMKIHAKQKYCNEWIENWIENCGGGQ